MKIYHLSLFRFRSKNGTRISVGYT